MQSGNDLTFEVDEARNAMRGHKGCGTSCHGLLDVKEKCEGGRRLYANAQLLEILHTLPRTHGPYDRIDGRVATTGNDVSGRL